jgi:hypothetical protein
MLNAPVEPFVTGQSPTSALNEISSIQEDLDDWIGEYEYLDDEYLLGATLSIYKEDEAYRAKIHLSGRMIGLNAYALVEGDEKEIAVIFEQHVYENIGSTYGVEPGDVLFWLRRFSNTGNIFTIWRTIGPRLTTSFKKISQPDETTETQANLDDWLGEYVYLYSTAAPDYEDIIKDFFEKNPSLSEKDLPAHMFPKYIAYEFIIYKDDEGRYSAAYLANGWMTGEEMQTTVRGNSEEIELVLQELTLFISSNHPEIGEVLFTLEKAGADIAVKWGWRWFNDLQGVIFKRVSGGFQPATGR